MISKITSDASYHTQLSKLLAMLQMTMKGTPFVFQGDEMGLANYQFTSMEQITDVEAKGYYAEHIQEKSHEEVFRKLLAGTREHCRVLLPWNEKLPEYHMGLHQEIKDDVQAVYKELIALRHSDKALVYGEFKVLDRKNDCFTYARNLDERSYIVDCNLGKEHRKAYKVGEDFRLVYPSKLENPNMLDAYEARIWIKQ